MSKSISQLGQEFNEKLAAHKALLAKGPEMTAEDALQAQSLVAEMRELKGVIEGVQRADRHQMAHAELEQWAQASAGAPLISALPGIPSGGRFGTFGNGVSVLGMEPDGTMVISPGRRGGVEILNLDKEGKADAAFKAGAFSRAREDDYKAAWRRMISRPMGDLTNVEQAALQEGQDTAGGFLAPDELTNRLIQRLPTPTRVAGRVMRLTTSKPGLTIPKVNYAADDLYTTGMRVTWTGETVNAGATSHRVAEPVFGQATIPVYTAMMSIPITQDLLEDSTVDLMAWLQAKFGETADLLRDNMILNGTGVNQPTGILAGVDSAGYVSSVASGDAGALTGDGLIELTEALPEQYDDNSVLVFNKTNCGKSIRKLKDGEGRYLVSYGAGDNGLAGGRYREVNGYPYIWSGFMPNVAANSTPIIFGDLNGYCAVDRLGFSVRALFELYAETNMVLLLGRVRFGGQVIEPWRLRVQKVAAN